MELIKQELARQSAKDAAEQERRDSSVMKGILLGDAMRGSAIRMAADPIDAVPFFRTLSSCLRYMRYLQSYKLFCCVRF